MFTLCRSDVKVKGTKDVLDQFIADAQLGPSVKEFDFNHVVPVNIATGETRQVRWGVTSLPTKFSFVTPVSLEPPTTPRSERTFTLFLAYTTSTGPATQFWKTVTATRAIHVSEVYFDTTTYQFGVNYIVNGKVEETKRSKEVADHNGSGSDAEYR